MEFWMVIKTKKREDQWERRKNTFENLISQIMLP